MKITIKAYLSKEDFFKLPSGEQRKKAEKYDIYKKYLKEGKSGTKSIHDGSKNLPKPAKAEKFDYNKTVNTAYKKANQDAKKLRKIDSEEGRDKEVAKIAKKMPKPTSIQEAIHNMTYLKQLADSSDINPVGKNSENSYNAIHNIYDKSAEAIAKKYGIHPGNMYDYGSLEELKKDNPGSKKIQRMSEQDYKNITSFNDAVDTISEDYGGW